MSELVRKVNAFFGQLARRHVVRVAGGYAVASFVVLQVGDLLFEAFAFPPIALTALAVVLILGAPVALGLAWAFDVTPNGIQRTPPTEGEGAVATAPPPRPAPGGPSLAVLPFTNMSGGNEAEYFSQGITEEIIVSLSRIPGVRVVSRTSASRYRDGGSTVQEIARELGVGAVLEGSVRRSEERVRIVAQLIDAETDDHLWVETYDRELEDIFRIQGDVATRIAASLRGRLTADEERRLHREPTGDLQAYDLYLKGRYLWNKRTEECLRRAVEYFREALERDPRFADAEAGLADSYATLGIYGTEEPRAAMPKAREAADRALALDAAHPAALTSRGCVRAVYDWDWRGAEEDFRRALVADPGYATGHHWYAVNLLAPLGRLAEARREAEEARRLEPLDPAVNTSLAFLAALEGRREEALEAYDGVIELESGFPLAHYFRGRTLDEMGRHDEAERSFARALELSGRSPEILSALGYSRACAEDREGARAALAELGSRGEGRWISPALLAQVHLGLGERERALDLLEEGLEARVPEMVWLRAREPFSELAGEPRFERMVEAVGLGGR